MQGHRDQHPPSATCGEGQTPVECPAPTPELGRWNAELFVFVLGAAAVKVVLVCLCDARDALILCFRNPNLSLLI